jgi:hypothetical protein
VACGAQRTGELRTPEELRSWVAEDRFDVSVL